MEPVCVSAAFGEDFVALVGRAVGAFARRCGIAACCSFLWCGVAMRDGCRDGQRDTHATLRWSTAMISMYSTSLPASSQSASAAPAYLGCPVSCFQLLTVSSIGVANRLHACVPATSVCRLFGGS